MEKDKDRADTRARLTRTRAPSTAQVEGHFKNSELMNLHLSNLVLMMQRHIWTAVSKEISAVILQYSTFSYLWYQRQLKVSGETIRGECVCDIYPRAY